MLSLAVREVTIGFQKICYWNENLTLRRWMEIFKSCNMLSSVCADFSLPRKTRFCGVIAAETEWKFCFPLYHSLTDSLESTFFIYTVRKQKDKLVINAIIKKNNSSCLISVYNSGKPVRLETANLHFQIEHLLHKSGLFHSAAFPVNSMIQ